MCVRKVCVLEEGPIFIKWRSLNRRNISWRIFPYFVQYLAVICNIINYQQGEMVVRKRETSVFYSIGIKQSSSGHFASVKFILLLLQEETSLRKWKTHWVLTERKHILFFFLLVWLCTALISEMLMVCGHLIYCQVHTSKVAGKLCSRFVKWLCSL